MNELVEALKRFGAAAEMAGGHVALFAARFLLARNKFSGNSHQRRKMRRAIQRKIAASEAFLATGAPRAKLLLD